MTNDNAHMFHQSMFAAAYLVDTGGRDLSRADTAFDDGTLRVTWDEGDIGVFEPSRPPRSEPPAAPTAEATAEAAAPPEATEPPEAPGPAMAALIAAFTAAHESDRAAKRRRTG
eukprot:COSAG06_NODE_1827_length_8276_cov_9.022991_5_plen_114_part_00